MYYPLIVLYSLIGLALLWLGYAFQNGKMKLKIKASAPSEDRAFWKEINKKLAKGYLVGAVGALMVAITIGLSRPILAEIGCITLLAALVFMLAILCKKTAFRPCDETEKLLKRWKLILLAESFGALFLTQLVFQYFNSLIQK